MLKKILLGLLVAIVLVLGYFTYFFFVGTRKASPSDMAVFDKDGLKMEINYSQPSKRGRLIFGPKEDGALVPFGEVWRTGANATTSVDFNKDIKLNGEILKAGTYNLFTIPRANQWTIIINNPAGWQWGAYQYNPENDILKTMVVPIKNSEDFEMFKIDFENTDSTSAIRMIWDNTKVLVPFE